MGSINQYFKHVSRLTKQIIRATMHHVNKILAYVNRDIIDLSQTASDTINRQTKV